MFKKILLTGGTGFIGQFLAVEFLQRDCQLVFLAREKHGLLAETRVRDALALVDTNALDGNFLVASGDLDNIPDWAGKNVDAIFHCAGDIRFEKKFAGQISATNLEGTKKMLAFASRHNIPEFHYVSTVFARDFMKNGIVKEDDLRLSDFVNSYTMPKALAEVKVMKWGKEKSERKVFIYAPSIVIGRSIDGLTTSMDGGWYRFMKPFAKMSDGTGFVRKKILHSSDSTLHLPVAVPGVVGATINVVTIDYVVMLIANLFSVGIPGVFNITNANAPEYDELLQMSLNVLGISGPSVRRDPKKTTKRVLRILQAAITRGTRDYRPFTSWTPRFSQENCRCALGDIFCEHPPITQELIKTLLNFALRCEFKKSRVYEIMHLLN